MSDSPHEKPSTLFTGNIEPSGNKYIFQEGAFRNATDDIVWLQYVRTKRKNYWVEALYPNPKNRRDDITIKFWKTKKKENPIDVQKEPNKYYVSTLTSKRIANLGQGDETIASSLSEMVTTLRDLMESGYTEEQIDDYLNGSR